MLILPAFDTSPPIATVVFLHGLSQTNTSWLSWLRLLALRFPNVKWILPQAEIGPVTYHQGAEGPRWFDVHALPPDVHRDDTATAEASKESIQAIVEHEIANGMPPSKVLLVGFSQGSAMALFSGLTFKQSLGGIAALAGWLPPWLREPLVNSHTAACPPLFWAHGTADSDIPLQNALETMDWLRASLSLKEGRLTYREYDGMKHQVNDGVLNDLSDWLTSVLSAS